MLAYSQSMSMGAKALYSLNAPPSVFSAYFEAGSKALPSRCTVLYIHCRDPGSYGFEYYYS